MTGVAVTIARIHIMIAFQGDSAVLKEWTFVENGGAEAVAVTEKLALFAGAVDVDISDSSPGLLRVSNAGGVAALEFARALPPGETKIEVSYRVSRKLGLRFSRKSAFGIGSVILMLEQDDLEVAGPTFAKGVRRVMGEASLVVARGGPIAAGGALEFEVSGTIRSEGAVAPAAQRPPPKAAAALGPKVDPGEVKVGPIRDWRQVRWLVVLALMGVYFGTLYLGGRRQRVGATWERELEDERDRLLREMAALPGDSKRRERVMGRLAEIYRLRESGGR